MPSRFDYVKYDNASQVDQEEAKHHCMVLEGFINENIECGRSKASALTKLEECYMWIGKGIRNDQIARNGSAELQEERTNS